MGLSESKITEQVATFTIYLKAKNLAASSIRTYSGVLTKFLSQINDCPDRLTAEQLTRYISTYGNSATMGQVRGTLQHYYAGVLGQKQKIQRVPYPKKTTRVPQVLRPDESMRLIGEIANSKHKAIVALLYFAAMRRSEVCNLRFKHLNPDHIFISQSKGAKDRRVPLSPQLREILKAYFAEYFPNGKCDREMYVFRGQTGGQYTGRSVEAIVAQQSNKTLKRHVNPHLLRHCRATDWLNNGLDIYNVSRLLGHTHVKTTEVYLHTATESLEDKMARADEMMMMRHKKTAA
jgi:integrase/recombinase XerD